MATDGMTCDEVALGNVAAAFVVNRSPPARRKALQCGGDHPTSILTDTVFTDSAKRLTI